MKTSHGGRVDEAKNEILLLYQQGLKVAYDRELRYRLESKFSHDDIAMAISELVREGKLEPTNVPGRKRINSQHPNKFYRLPDSNYQDILPIMKKKLELSAFVAGVIKTAGEHAERVWYHAFKRNGWNVFPVNEADPLGVNKYKGKEASINNDIDFIVEKDNIEYGVEIKNGLGYPDDLYWKFIVAAELNTIPLIIARWLNPAQIPLVRELGGEYLIYKEALYPETYKSIVEDCRKTLGMPIIALDEIEDHYFNRKVNDIHQRTKLNYQDKKNRIREFLSTMKNNPKVRKTLGDKTT